MFIFLFLRDYNVIETAVQVEISINITRKYFLLVNVYFFLPIYTFWRNTYSEYTVHLLRTTAIDDLHGGVQQENNRASLVCRLFL